MKKTITDDVKKKVIEKYNYGISSGKIAKQLKIGKSSVLRILETNNITRECIKKKTIRENIEDIIYLYKLGESPTNIAKKYNVSQNAIWENLKKSNVKMKSKSESHRIYEINEDYFDNIDTEEKAYFLGFLYADGCNLTNGYAVTINLANGPSERNLLYKFANIIYKNNPDSHVHFYNHTNKNTIGENDKFVSLSIYSKYMCKKLNEIGCTPVKSLNLDFPKWLNCELYSHFIRGFYDGDGGINNLSSGALLAIVGTNNMLINIKEIIKKECDINFPFYKMGKIYKIQVGGNRQVIRILNWMYKDASIFLHRKYNRYLELLNLNKKQDEKHRPYVFVSNKIKLEIMKQYEDGLSSTIIGNNLGIDRNRILRILKNNNVKIRKNKK